MWVRWTGTTNLTITDRKKDIVITSCGENISSTTIETALRGRPLISRAVVDGDNRTYLVALLTLDRDEAPVLAERLGMARDPAAMGGDERMHQAFQAEVDEVNRRFARIEQIKRFAILDRDLTQPAGDLTPTTRVKRETVYDRFGETLERVYD